MNYEKKYKESMAKMSTFLAKHDGFTISKDGEIYKELSEIFPELAESEDERIRKGLIEACKQSLIVGGFHKDKVISWLEKQGEQKPVWSEEDEKQARQIERIVHNDGCTQKLQKQIADWLKSLKDRYTWKPSEEQMKQLGWIAEQNKDNIIGKELMTLYQDLKKLMQE